MTALNDSHTADLQLHTLIVLTLTNVNSNCCFCVSD